MDHYETSFFVDISDEISLTVERGGGDNYPVRLKIGKPFQIACPVTIYLPSELQLSKFRNSVNEACDNYFKEANAQLEKERV